MNWVLELTPGEGRALLEVLDRRLKMKHSEFEPRCPLCRARSRISLGRDYGFGGLLPETREVITSLVRGKK